MSNVKEKKLLKIIRPEWHHEKFLLYQLILQAHFGVDIGGEIVKEGQNTEAYKYIGPHKWSVKSDQVPNRWNFTRIS